MEATAGPKAARGEEIWLFTMQFPYGNGEAFLENELPYLAEGFRHVRIFPMLGEGSARAMPPGVQVENPFSTEEAYRPMAWWRLLRHLGPVLRLRGQARSSAPTPAVYRKHRREFLSQLRQALERERLFTRRYAAEYRPERVRLYSYWTGDWATVLGLWKMRDARVRFVSRMMGFDMFDHRAPDGWQRFQCFHLEQVERVYVIAQAGMEHVQRRFPEHAHKLRLSYLATTDHGPGPWQPAPELRVASCANLVELKRVHLIAEALRQVQGPVHWTHFGDGPERGRVEAAVRLLPSSVRVDLKGSRPNREVIAWYQANPVDVFVHASRTEGGAPVALQEAASFGIPLVAADAGGVAEVVTSASGILLPNGLTADELGKALAGFQGGAWYAAPARQAVRTWWDARFNARRVHAQLTEELKP